MGPDHALNHLDCSFVALLRLLQYKRLHVNVIVSNLLSQIIEVLVNCHGEALSLFFP